MARRQPSNQPVGAGGSGPPATRFGQAAQTLTVAARGLGLVVPIFRSPPRDPALVRSIRRTRRGATVSVVITGRPWPSVLADLVDGIVAVNELDPAAAIRARTTLWAALASDEAAA